MHLVDLEVGADKAIRLELHPTLTVVQAGAKSRERLASLLGRAYALAGTEVTGVVDGGGYLTPFDPTAVVSLDLSGEGLDVIGPADLPPPDPSRREAARRDAEAAIERAAVVLGQLAGERDEVERLQQATSAAVAAGSEERDGARSMVVDLAAALAAVDQRGTERESERTAAVAAVAAAASRRSELGEVRAEIAELLGPSEDGSTLRNGDDTRGLAAAVERAAALGALRASDRDQIDAWLSALATATAATRPDALAMASEIEEVELAWQQAAGLGVEGDPDVVRLTAERADIAQNHDLLVRLSDSGVLGQTAKSQIDEAHVAVVRAVKGEVDQAVAAEVEVLARYGFDSYLEYTIAISTRSVGQALDAKLAELTARVDSLDVALRAARTAAADRLERLAARREPAQERVTAFLGFRPDGSAVEHLRRIPEVPVPVSRLTVTVDEAVELADSELLRFRETVRELDDEGSDLARRVNELDDRRRVLEARIAELDDVLRCAVVQEQELAARRSDADAALATATEEVGERNLVLQRLEEDTTIRYTGDDVPRAVDAVASRVAVSAARREPVLLTDTFAPFAGDDAVRALEVLAARSELCQLVYVTDDRSICEWARALDPGVGRFESVSRWSPRRLRSKVLGRRRRAGADGLSR